MADLRSEAGSVLFSNIKTLVSRAVAKINRKKTNATGGNRSLCFICMSFIGRVPSSEHMIVLSVERRMPPK